MTKSAPMDGDERLADWLDGRMSPRDLERFEAEMRVSKPLREKAEAYARTARAVKDAFSAPGPSIDVAAAVLARLAGASGSGAAPGPAARGASTTSSAGGIAAEGGRVLPFPRSMPSAWIWSGLVACAMVTLVLVLERWHPAPVESRDARAPVAPDVSAPRSDDVPPGASAADGTKTSLDSGAFYLRRMESDAQHEVDGAAADPASRPEPTDAPPADEPVGSDPPRSATGAEDSASRLAVPEPLPADETVDPREDRETGIRSPRAMAFGLPTPGAAPRTTVPTIRLRSARKEAVGADPTRRLRSATDRDADGARAKSVEPGSPGRDPQSGSGDLLAGAVELDRALGNVQVFRLPSVPGAIAPEAERALEPGRATRADGSGTWSSGTPQAWLIEGPAEDVQAFLSTLSEAGRARGYEVLNGEVTVAELQAVDPSLPASPGARFVPRSSRSKGGDLGFVGQANDGMVGGGAAKEEAPAPESGAQGSRAQDGGSPRATPPRPSGSRASPTVPGSAGPAAPAPSSSGPSSPGPAGPAPRPTGGGALLVMPVRVLVVIEPTK